MKSIDQKGFTLIELVVVLIIVGIVAVVAAPRFMNLSTAARTASLDGVASAMESVINQVQAKSYIQGLVPEEKVPSGGNAQADYVIDFGIGSVEVDWGTLCPESEGEAADKLDMVDFLTLNLSSDMTFEYGNRHLVVGYDYPFESKDLDSAQLDTLPDGCYVIYDSFGRKNGSRCPAEGCVCTVRIVDTDC
ncbi:prepilin-type N-terminal cleavage/methylation domain-containing protein [Vibrio panuliri]|uniref:MSHA biogenesis protein MshA n=1 Tax=Vibrio panuliri TaxID=1381081 RepID=A0ABX3FBG3_9VIBR|nr:prepilin-type N-terminal cleavage/methylation domain-containing protein [Vibrio panuliri]KAB1454172.1 prepilin-type N-terminal cleavage/methylation domain-containing protein [Vibrio panuliri]OLQ86457.1 MSHA biogenesis protein MshA [Vibrio panuliri]